MQNLKKLIQSISLGELVVIAGTGVSAALTGGKNPCLSWTGLIKNGLGYCETKGKITSAQNLAWNSHLSSSDIDDLLGAAEFMSKKLGAPSDTLYARWLQSTFEDVRSDECSMAEAIRLIQHLNIPICTLNYDFLLENVTGLPTTNITDVDEVVNWMQKKKPAILHLHGSWNKPETCILGIRSYETTLNNEVRDLIQRSLASFKRLLFIGCGDTFSDPNFAALTQWLKDKMKAATPQHFALVSDEDLQKRHSDTSWVGFIEPIAFGKSHSDLPLFLKNIFSSIDPASKATVKPRTSKSIPKTELISKYKSFLLKDCGQMTIEGVRADMDTAQQRFDLEKLFVPLSLMACPPEIAANDPLRESKLEKWEELNKKPLDFGEVFKKNRRLALLALPGGGKTLLLKRLAVAYADPARRKSSADKLPNLKLTPVLIRCREWQDYIRKPIPSLLRNLPEITGHAELSGLYEELIPLLKQGSVLLLVDGLDEIHDDGDRTAFVENLESFLTDFNKIRVVVTSREAGFNLVAPCLARFCERYLVAPLSESAIDLLCEYWHRLMAGNSPETLEDGRTLAAYLIKGPSLRRLAENPLLLTMLLVVKHGAGRLPPDRVSLYGRAVEVLLDTWNIKGHEALNLKEAIPQLAFIAFQMMRMRKQTATEKELLEILEVAREEIPQIRRYAKDTPYAFLKRVELRSSLLVEAGYQLENGCAVPFYQFRHLTFQEYLAAIAAAEGHYVEYEKGSSVLTPLRAFLISDEWKEVIPMAAVLARKQAEPLVSALIQEGNLARDALIKGDDFIGDDDWRSHFGSLPPAVARLAQCFIEEAEAEPDSLAAALQLIGFFARGCNADADWAALMRGPYGNELLHQVWTLYQPMDWPEEISLFRTYGELVKLSKPMEHWIGEAGQEEINILLSSTDEEKNTKGIYVSIMLMFGNSSPSGVNFRTLQHEKIIQFLFSEKPELWSAACWFFGVLYYNYEGVPKPSNHVLDRLTNLWLGDSHPIAIKRATIALFPLIGHDLRGWQPILSAQQTARIKILEQRAPDELTGDYSSAVGVLIGFYAKSVWTIDEIASKASRIVKDNANRGGRSKVIEKLVDLIRKEGGVVPPAKKLKARKSEIGPS